MELLEEMLRFRDEYERDDIPDMWIVRHKLNDIIDKIITEGMQNRK